MTRAASRLAIAAYGAPTLPESVASIAVVVVVPGYYTSTLAIPAATVGLALLLSRVLDALSDPLIGYLSDLTRGPRFGRKPMVVMGAFSTALGAWMLFLPPSGVDGWYLGLWTLVFYLGWTLYSVPYNAWGAELGAGTEDRTRVFTWRAVYFYLGMTAFFVAPLLPGRTSTAVDRPALAFNGLLVAFGLPALALLAASAAPPGEPPPPAPSRDRVVDLARSIARNRPLLLYVINAVLCGLGNGMNITLAFVFVADYLRTPALFSWVVVVNVVANLVALPLWRPVVTRLGKNRAWGLGLLLNGLTMPMFCVVQPGSAGLWPLLVVAALSGASYSVCNVVLPAILADVIDYERWRSGRGRAGGYFAIFALVTKFNNAVGGGLGLLLIGAFGYVAGAPLTASAMAGLLIAFAGVPTLLQVIAAVMAWRFPLDERRRDIVRRRLDARPRTAMT